MFNFCRAISGSKLFAKVKRVFYLLGDSSFTKVVTSKQEVNSFMPIVFSHPYQLDQSISNCRLLGGIFDF